MEQRRIAIRNKEKQIL